MQRKEIINILIEEINDIDPNIIRTNHSFENFTENDQSVLAHFNNQKSFKGSIIVGCDGINSTVKKIMLPESKNKFSGIIAWRGLVDMKKLSSNIQDLSSTVWMGQNSHFVHYPIKKGKFLNFIGTLKKEKWESSSWHQAGSKEELISDYKDWHTTVKEIINNNYKVVNDLLSKRLINSRSVVDGKPLLIHAVINDRPDMVNLLIRFGAQPYADYCCLLYTSPSPRDRG